MGHLLTILGTVALVAVTLAVRNSAAWGRDGSAACALFMVFAAMAYVAIVTTVSGLGREESDKSRNSITR